MNSFLRLDWKGDAEIAPDARLVETEVQWLQVAPTLRAPNADGVWVRGADLCEWARQWWQAMGGQCEDVRNAIDALLALVPKLGRDEAKTIADALKARGQGGALHLLEILALLFADFGENGSLWTRSHSAHNRLEIAAHWLLWLETRDEIEPSYARLIERQCEIWRDTNRDYADLFPVTAEAARGALTTWLGLERQAQRGSFAALEPFPLAISPHWLGHARDYYARIHTRLREQRERRAGFLARLRAH